MHPGFSDWLHQRFPKKTASTRLANVKKIEAHYGRLDDFFLTGTYQQDIVNTLEYNTADEIAKKKNPSKIKFKGDIRNNLNMYKNAAKLYKNFLEEMGPHVERTIANVTPDNTAPSAANDEGLKQRLSLERDMQVALRQNIESLDQNLKIIDDGLEKDVDSGSIDITCEDNDGIVVIELKAGKADSRAIGQILGYMGDIQEANRGRAVRGILVAHDFDTRTKSAARIVQSLTLKKYSIEFKFTSDT